MADLPELENVLITGGGGPGPYGSKAVGELCNTPLPAAIANAVYDAVGVRLEQYPATAERVFRALAKAATRNGAGALRSTR
jgi:CO/xanthine dehydrogenase Mo-binding subunit